MRLLAVTNTSHGNIWTQLGLILALRISNDDFRLLLHGKVLVKDQ